MKNMTGLGRLHWSKVSANSSLDLCLRVQDNVIQTWQVHIVIEKHMAFKNQKADELIVMLRRTF